jgi:hypothetical protein
MVLSSSSSSDLVAEDDDVVADGVLFSPSCLLGFLLLGITLRR